MVTGRRITSFSGIITGKFTQAPSLYMCSHKQHSLNSLGNTHTHTKQKIKQEKDVKVKGLPGRVEFSKSAVVRRV